MTTTPKHVLARHGRWRHESRGDELTAIIGSFDRGDFSAAQGTRTYLQRSGIAPRLELENGSGGYVLRLTQGNADLHRFEAWAGKHGLLPRLRRQREDEELAHAHEQLRREHRFTPLDEKEADDLIARLHWQCVEPPPGSRHAGVVVASLSHPQRAFQAAHRLMAQGYLPREDFERLNAEINDALDRKERRPEFRIALQGRIPPAVEYSAAIRGAVGGQGSGHGR